MNIAFETALGYMGKVSSPRVITGNPHLLVERAERRFGFEVVRIPDGGAMSLKRLREEITDESVVAVYVALSCLYHEIKTYIISHSFITQTTHTLNLYRYSQSLSYTDGISDNVPEIVKIIEQENRRRKSMGLRPVVHINDCCLSLSVLLLNPKTMRVFELAQDTPTLVSLDAHKHMGAEKGISTVFSTQNTLSRVMQGKIRVGAEPSDGDLIRAIMDLNSFSVKGYENLYRDLQDIISNTVRKLENAGMRQVRTAHRRYVVYICI